MVEVWDSTTLERVSDLRPPAMPVKVISGYLTFSPNGHLLACIYDLVRGSNPLVSPSASLSILTPSHRSTVCIPHQIVVWDIQTGMVINNLATWDLGKIFFSGDQSTITIVTRTDFCTYNRLTGEHICEGELLPSSNHQLGACWVHENTLRFAISSETDQELLISIQELQPTSDPLLHIVSSFSILPQNGVFSFSPVSFHASFVSMMEVVIFDVQGSKVLFQSKEAGAFYSHGSFSHDGCFFTCSGAGEIHIWENTSTGYMPRNSLSPRFLWHWFSWSPTSISILCWGDNVIQLLHPDNCLNPISPDVEKHGQYTNHLVAYSADQAHIIIGQHGGGLITVLDLFGTTQQSIHTNAVIKDIKIVGDKIFVINGNKLSSWHLATGRQVNSICGIKENTALHVYMESPLVLSNTCSQVAFASGNAVFLYDVKAQKVLGNLSTDGDHIIHIQFSPDESQLWWIVRFFENESYKCYHVELDREKNSCFGNVTTNVLEGEWSLDSLFRSPDQCRIVGERSKWVSDSRGNVLWLPLNWRNNNGLGTRWDCNFLALLSGYHPEPVIIEFRS